MAEHRGSRDNRAALTLHELWGFDGVYEVAEAARYLRSARMADEVYGVTSRRLIRWIRRGLMLRPLAGVPGRELIIGFEDLVSMRVIAALRAAGVSFQKIYTAERWLRERTGHARPFATQLLWTETSDVFAEFQEALVAASRHGQLALDLLRNYLIPVHGLYFSPALVANAWEPRSRIRLEPHIQFGAPCIKGTRIPTRAVWAMVNAGDGVRQVTESYGITDEEARAAIEWENALAA